MTTGRIHNKAVDGDYFVGTLNKENPYQLVRQQTLFETQNIEDM